MLDLTPLSSLIVEILEEQAFLFGDEAEPADLPEVLRDSLHVTLEFEGSGGTGCFHLSCARDLCDELAANVLGVNELSEEDAELGEDAIKELLNVIVGRALDSLSLSDTTFALGSPGLSMDEDGSIWQKLHSDPSVLGLSVEEHPVLIGVEFTHPEALADA